MLTTINSKGSSGAPSHPAARNLNVTERITSFKMKFHHSRKITVAGEIKGTQIDSI